MSQVLPAPEEVPALVPRPGDLLWRTASDIRLLGAAGYALLLQVAHPTVGAGVAEHSDFERDPWGRLLRTLDYVNGTIYGGPEMAGEIGRQIRQMHTTITGVRPDGERYSALEPGAFAWVHATLVHSIVEGHRHLARPMARAEIEEFYAGWRKLGRLVGVRDRDLPDTWWGFENYFAEMVAHELVDNPTVHTVVRTLGAPAAPPVRGIGPGTWRALRFPAAKQMHLFTLGLLPAHLRERLNLDWSPREERAFRALAALSRAGTPLVHGPLREFGPAYLEWRRKAREEAAA